MEESPFIVKPGQVTSTDHTHSTAGRKGEFSTEVVKGVEVRVRVGSFILLHFCGTIIIIQTSL